MAGSVRAGTQRSLSVRAVVMLAATLSGSCSCVHRLKAQAQTAELRSKSIERSGEPMRAAAARLGATLLPHRLETWREPSQCWSGGFAHTVACEPWWALADYPVGRVEAPDGKWHQVIPVGDDGSEAYARVARRGDTLFVLTPRIERRAVDTGTACECDAGPIIVVTTYRALVLPDLDVKKVERVVVPVTEDYIDWECQVLLVDDRTARRHVAGSSAASACD